MKNLFFAVFVLAVTPAVFADDVSMTVKLENNNYIITVDGAKCTPVKKDSLTTKEQTFPCNDNYEIKGHTYTGYFGGIYAYFEAFHHGGDEALADAETKIGERPRHQPSWKYGAK